MKDSIDKNLDFKLFIFITLLGVWWWLLKYASTSDFSKSSPKQFLILFSLFVSYFIFYPLLKLGAMLVYISLHQVAENDAKERELEARYKKNAKIFFEWWPFTIITAPTLLFVVVFSDLLKKYTLILPVLYILIVLKYYFKKIFTFTDFIKYYPGFFVWFVVYMIGIISIISVLKVLGQ